MATVFFEPDDFDAADFEAGFFGGGGVREGKARRCAGTAWQCTGERVAPG
jgi:hypothetical protein